MIVGIVAANNIRYSPYIFFYTNILDKMGVDYELIFPNRMNVEDTFPAKTHIVPWDKSVHTALAYLDYTGRAKKIIKQNQYDLLVMLTTNNAVYMAQWLRRHYKKRYILDIRDYTHENLYLYYTQEKIAVKNSLINVISSKKFKEFLPLSEYVVCHNMNIDASVHTPKLKKSPPIIIGYIGKGNYLDKCKIICEKICKDNRFEFVFYGLQTVPDLLKTYEKYENISFKGIFTPKEKELIILSTDILFNVYGNGTPLLDYALSNKLYDAFIYGKPILTSPNTYMSEMAGPFAFDVDFKNESFADDLYNWYIGLNEHDLLVYAQEKYKQIVDESNYAQQCIQKAIMQS